MGEYIMVIGAHPDDELLGSAGTIKRLINEGYKVISIITALGRKEEAHHIKQLGERANQELGIEKVIFLEHTNLELECIPLHKLVKELEQLIRVYQPEKIFTHHYGDVNMDHQRTFQAVLTAARPLPNQKPIELLTFETLSSSEWERNTADKLFKPNYFVNITDTMDARTGMRVIPHFYVIVVKRREFGIHCVCDVNEVIRFEEFISRIPLPLA